MLYKILSTFDHNPHYLNRYIKFILTCSEKNVNQKNMEKHHICPKSKYLFPQYQSFTKNPWNQAKLTYIQHYIAHLILSKVYTRPIQQSSMLKAFYRMSSVSKYNNRSISSRMFEKCKIANRDAMKLNNPMKSLETRKRMSIAIKEMMQTEKGILLREHMSKTRTGRCDISEEGLKRLSDMWTGVPRPKTESHITNHRKSLSSGLFRTPFGNFDSPQQASDSERNIKNLSRYQINKLCKEHKDGFYFIPKKNSQTL